MKVVENNLDQSVSVSGEQFFRLAAIGKVTSLSGKIRSSATGRTQPLHLNGVGSVRPPMDTITEEDVLDIEDIVITMAGGTVLSKEAVLAILEF